MSHDPVVNFSDLSTDKKQEFLSFLLNNNIKFQEGQDNYIAKVTLKDAIVPHKQNREQKEHKEHKEHRQPIRHSPSPSKKSTKQQPAQTTPINARKKKPLQQTPNNIERHRPDKVLSPLPVKRTYHHTRNSTMAIQTSHVDPPERERSPSVVRERNRSKSANDKKQQPQVQPIHRERAVRQKSQHELSNSKVKINNSLQYIKANNQENIPPPANKPTRQVPQNVKSQIYQPCKMQQLISILHIQTISTTRPTRWPRNQVLKTIQQIYSGNFNKNTLLLKKSKFKEAYDRGSCTFSSYVIEHFQQKYRTPKLLHSNLLNLSHSLLSYIYQGGQSSGLTTFHFFLTEQYEYQDLLFFLFIRSIFEKEFSTTMQKILASGQEHTLTRKQVTRFIKAVLGKDSPETVTEFQALVAEHMSADTISVYMLFQVMLEDYQAKRKCRSTSQISGGQQTVRLPNPKSSEPAPHDRSFKSQPTKQTTKSSGQSLFNDNSSSNFQQLTFGEYNASASNRLEEQDQTEFWNDFESLQVNEGDELIDRIQEKLKKKVYELVQIMLGEEGNGVSPLRGPAKQLGKLILAKALRMLQAIAAMDKIRWFRLIRVGRPEQKHLDVVESLQMSLRSLRKISRDNQALSEVRNLQSQFCKNLLTVEQLKRAIEKIVIG